MGTYTATAESEELAEPHKPLAQQLLSCSTIVTPVPSMTVTIGSAARTCEGANTMALTASDAVSSSFKVFPAFIDLPASEGPSRTQGSED